MVLELPLASHCLSVPLCPGRGSTENKVYRQRLPSLPLTSMRSLLLARRGVKNGNAFKVVNHRGQLGQLQLVRASSRGVVARERREYCSVNVQSIKIKCVNNLCVQRCDIYAPFPSACIFLNVTKSTTNRYQSISINLSIAIGNRYQSITTRIFAIDWSSIININRLIDIDWY